MTVQALERVAGFPPGAALATFVGGHWLAIVAGFAGMGMLRSLSVATGLLSLVVFVVTAD